MEKIRLKFHDNLPCPISSYLRYRFISSSQLHILSVCISFTTFISLSDLIQNTSIQFNPTYSCLYPIQSNTLRYNSIQHIHVIIRTNPIHSDPIQSNIFISLSDPIQYVIQFNPTYLYYYLIQSNTLRSNSIQHIHVIFRSNPIHSDRI